MSDYRLSSRAIVIKDNHILLNEFNNGEYYNIPGGGVEKDETLRDAVAREVLEESGLTVNVKEMLYIYEYNPSRDGFRFGPRGGLSHVFRCEIDCAKEISTDIILDQDPSGRSICTGCKWIPINKLNSIKLVPNINDIIIKDVQDKDYTTKFLEGIH